VADEEDVVLQAFDSLFRRAGQGKFPELNDRHDLWRLLVKIAERKASNQRRDAARRKRGGGRVRGHSVFMPAGESAESPGLGCMADDAISPDLAVEVTETAEMLLGSLDEGLRQIAVWKMEGFTNDEIAAKLGRSVATIERRLKLIRAEWEARIEKP
jgi:DNA-directed RNA polymerase specialized sigma24 family protein